MRESEAKTSRPAQKTWLRYGAGLVVLGSLVLVVFSERRNIAYDFFGPRRSSFAEITYFLLIAGYVGYRAVTRQLERSSGTLRILSGFLTPLLAISVLLWLTCANCPLNSPIRGFHFLGLTLLMGLIALAIDGFSKEELLKGVFLYALLMIVLLGSQYFVIRWTDMADVSILRYGTGTSTLYYPFQSPNQAALFGGLVFLLGVGGALIFKRTYLLYLVVPLSFLAITQTGSRSVTWLLLITWVAYVATLVVVARTNRGWLGRAVLHLLVSSIVAVALFAVSSSVVGFRSVSLFFVSLASIVSGDADLYRGTQWAEIVHEPVSMLPQNIGNYINSHNVYLDILVHGGVVIFILFLVFMAAVLTLAVILAWVRRSSDSFPVYLSLLAAVMLVIGALYANPLIHMRYVWILFAVVIVLYAKYLEEKRKASVRLERDAVSEHGCKTVTVRVDRQG